jgi:hypothetical protein
MSGFYLLVLIGLWLSLGWTIFRLWRRYKQTDLRLKIMHVVIGILIFSIWFGYAFWEVAGKKIYWDAKVREMCAIDGGVKVYETVVLTSDLLDNFGRINIPDKRKLKPSDKYYSEWTITHIRKKNPVVTRYEVQIVRRSDGKILGELISYGRGGGDLYGPWHPSSFTCPEPVKGSNFETSIFLKENKN